MDVAHRRFARWYVRVVLVVTLLVLVLALSAGGSPCPI